MTSTDSEGRILRTLPLLATLGGAAAAQERPPEAREIVDSHHEFMSLLGLRDDSS